jgi:hypothetical protein
MSEGLREPDRAKRRLFFTPLQRASLAASHPHM